MLDQKQVVPMSLLGEVQKGMLCNPMMRVSLKRKQAGADIKNIYIIKHCL